MLITKQRASFSRENHIRVFPMSIDFGEVSLGRPAFATVQIDNLENDVVDCTVAEPGDGIFTTTEMVPCGLLRVGESCIINVSFAPAARTEYTNTMRIICNEPYKEDLHVQLHGQGI